MKSISLIRIILDRSNQLNNYVNINEWWIKKLEYRSGFEILNILFHYLHYSITQHSFQGNCWKQTAPKLVNLYRARLELTTDTNTWYLYIKKLLFLIIIIDFKKKTRIFDKHYEWIVIFYFLALRWPSLLYYVRDLKRVFVYKVVIYRLFLRVTELIYRFIRICFVVNSFNAYLLMPVPKHVIIVGW